MKYLCFVVLLTLSVSAAHTDQPGTLGPLLAPIFDSIGADEQLTVWIYLADKGEGAASRLSLPPETFISSRAIERRARVMNAENIVSEEDLPLEQSYINTIAAHVTRIRQEAKWFNAISAVATKQQVEHLRALPFIREIDLVGRFRPAAEEVTMENATPVENPAVSHSGAGLNYGNSFNQNNQINTIAVHNLGINGSGVLIGIFDAGFSNQSHPAIATRPVIARYDFVANSPTLGSHSHGQNTFSVIGGFADGNLIGPAYGASFVLARTEDATPETPIEEDNWVRAIIWADSIGIDVASTSLGYVGFDSPWPSYTWQHMDGRSTVITRAADRASELGIVVVNSAGNSGFNSTRNTLGAPSDGFNVIAAGAVTSSGVRSSFSSVGPSVDGRIKPDVMAMGSSVRAASGASGYTNVSGTSFSCPLSGGVAALVLSANPGLTPFQVREAMRQTASRANSPDREYGWGILNALKAINYPWITHTPLQDTEDTTARTLLINVRSRIPLNLDSSRVVYGIGGGFTGSTTLAPTMQQDEYVALIPFLGNGASVRYYIIAQNAEVTTRLPLDAPATFFSYSVGPDTDGPSIDHTPLGNQSHAAWPPAVVALVEDPSGVDSVLIEYSHNGQVQPPFPLVLNGVVEEYSGIFPLDASSVNPGDQIAYRVAAYDRAAQRNVSHYPDSGYISFSLSPFTNLSIDFETTAAFSPTNDWQWGIGTGTSPPATSGTRYWATNLSGNYPAGPRLSSLTTPKYYVFSDRAKFSFKHWFEIQSRFDGGNVKVSVNGAPYQLIHPVGGYPIDTIARSFNNPLMLQPAYSGVEGISWTSATFNLTGIAGEGDSVSIRFDFGVDNSIQYRGWYVDDFASDGFGIASPTGVEEGPSIPASFTLHQNYPNPFNPETVVRFSLPEHSSVSLVVHDVLGRVVRTVLSESRGAGAHSIIWDGKSDHGHVVASGVYLYTFTAQSVSGRRHVQTMKLVLMR